MLRMMLVMALLLPVSKANALTYYTRSNGNWTALTTWSLIGYGGMATAAFPTVLDTAKIGDGYTVTINTACSCARLEVGQGTSGILQYSGASSYSLTVTGSITVYPGGSFTYTSNSSKTHTLSVGGNFTNNGTVDLYLDANDIVNTTFNTSSNSVVSGTGTWELNNVTINKSSSSASVEVQASAFESAIATLAGTTGTYIHNNSGSYSVNSASASDFAINQNMVFNVPQGTMTFSPNSTRTYLYGALYVSGGNVYIGNTTGTNGIRYDQIGSGVPYLEVSAGTLTVYGGINYASSAGSDPFSFRMTGGNILLNSGTSGTSSEVFLVNDVASSSFYMSGGTITIQNHNGSGGSNSTDWKLNGTAGTVVSLGGTVQFGNNSTAAGSTFTFEPYPNITQPNFKITGTTASTHALQPGKSTTNDFKLLSLYIDTNKTVDIRSIQGVPGDSKIMTLTSTYDGTYAYYSRGTYSAQQSTVVMGGTEAQAMGGTVSSTFYYLTIDNPAGVTLGLSENVSKLLTMTSGLLNTTSSKIITCTSTADATMGSSTSFVNGPMVQTIANAALNTRNFPIGKGTIYRPAVLTATHSNGTSVTYTGEMMNSSATALNYAMPSTVNRVSNTRYWDFTRANVANLSSAALTLYYDLDDTIPDKTRVVVVHDDGSARWVDYGGTATADTAGSITSINITSFRTKFSFGFPPSPLPIELVSFNAKKSGHLVRCEWETATETNNDFFTVERSADGTHFSTLACLKGAGNSSKHKYYMFEDINPLDGDSYYRLKQTDFDGKFTCSPTEHVFFGPNTSAYTLFPNPSVGTIHLQQDGKSLEGINAVIQDMSGKQVPANLLLSKDKGELTINIDPSAYLVDNFIVLNIVSAEGIVKEKVFVEKR